MRRPLVFVERFSRIPTRVELFIRVGGQSYTHCYDEPSDATPQMQAQLLTQHLHAFASEVQDTLAATL